MLNVTNLLEGVEDIEVTLEGGRWNVDGQEFDLGWSVKDIERRQEYLMQEVRSLEALKTKITSPEHKEAIEALHEWRERRMGSAPNSEFLAGFEAARKLAQNA